MNQITLVGRLTKDVELRYIAGSGTAVAQFSLAVDREFAGKDGKRETDFIDIQVWGKQAESCANYIGKGSLVAVNGSLRIDIYQNQAGENRRSARVNANRVQFLTNNNRGVQAQPTGTTNKNVEFDPSKAFSQNEFEQEFQAIADVELPF